MKKPYIRPESRLFAINLAENIAAGSGGYVMDNGPGINQGPGYQYYSNYLDAKVTVPENSSDFAYYLEFIMVYVNDPQNRWPNIQENCWGKVL